VSQLKKKALIRLALIVVAATATALDSPGQQPAAVKNLPQAASQADQSGQVQQRQPGVPLPYYDYPYASETTSSRTLSVEQAVTLALENAASLRQAQFDEQGAREDVKQARAGLLPQFTMPLTYWGTTPSMGPSPWR